jgi:hypothetical protein
MFSYKQPANLPTGHRHPGTTWCLSGPSTRSRSDPARITLTLPSPHNAGVRGECPVAFPVHHQALKARGFSARLVARLAQLSFPPPGSPPNSLFDLVVALPGTVALGGVRRAAALRLGPARALVLIVRERVAVGRAVARCLAIVNGLARRPASRRRPLVALVDKDLAHRSVRPNGGVDLVPALAEMLFAAELFARAAALLHGVAKINVRVRPARRWVKARRWCSVPDRVAVGRGVARILAIVKG